MASELSRFIEDELRKQGINDDEEQRLLSNLRVKPLSVQATPPTPPRGWSTKQKILAVAGLAILFGALLALVVSQRGHPTTTGTFRGAIADPEAGVEPLPMPAGKQKDSDDAGKGGPKPPQEPDTAQKAAAVEEEDYEEDYSDYEEGEREPEEAQQEEEEAEEEAAVKQPAAKEQGAAVKKDTKRAGTPTLEEKDTTPGKEEEEEEEEEEGNKKGGRRLRDIGLRD